MNLAKMRRSPIIHGPQPPRRVVVLDDEIPSIPEHAGARHFIDRVREVYDEDTLREIHLEVLDWPVPADATSQRIEIRAVFW